MRSIYAEALGPDFHQLHPRMQERFGFASGDSVASIGRGVMARVWHGTPLVLPFLWIGTLRNIMFPEQGEQVDFEVANYAYRDEQGRELVSWIRTFRIGGRTRRFDAYMAVDPERRVIVDYFGTHGHFAVDLHLSVSPEGGVAIRSGAQRFHLGRATLPCPRWLSGEANVVEWWDEETERYRIRVTVTNPLIGPIFGYEGEFGAVWERTAYPPAHILPRRALPL